MYLNEVFDKMHKWSWAIQEPDEWVARFGSENNEAVEVKFHRGDAFVGDIWSLGFWRDSHETITGQGDAFAIFGTVADIVKDFVRKVKPEFIEFGAKEPNRAKLYNRMLPILAKELGMKHERHGDVFVLAVE